MRGGDDQELCFLLKQALQIARGQDRPEGGGTLGSPVADLRLEIRGLAKQVTAMVIADAARIQPMLDAAIEKAVAEFDFERAVLEAVDAALAAYIKRAADLALWSGNVDGKSIESAAREAFAAVIAKWGGG